MTTIERMNELLSVKCRPGVVVDEDFSNAEGQYIYYAFYDEKGRLRLYMDLPRSATPEQISEVLNDYADEYLRCNPQNLTTEQVAEKIIGIRDLAKNVPGLHKK